MVVRSSFCLKLLRFFGGPRNRVGLAAASSRVAALLFPATSGPRRSRRPNAGLLRRHFYSQIVDEEASLLFLSQWPYTLKTLKQVNDLSTHGDAELILEFAKTRSDAAFREIVKRHANMVQGTAQRVLRDPRNAEEVTQTVFILLARKATSLGAATCVAGWLYRTARYVSLEAL